MSRTQDILINYIHILKLTHILIFGKTSFMHLSDPFVSFTIVKSQLFISACSFDWKQ